MPQKWTIEEPAEAAGLDADRFASEMQAAIDHGVFSPLARAVFTEALVRLRGASGVMDSYIDWYQDSPEDSWRLQRDMCSALHCDPEEEE